MLKLYYLKIEELTDKKLKTELKKYLSEERRAAIDLLKFEDDQTRSILGELLIRYGICQNSVLKNSDINFIKNEYGKPFLNNVADVYFSLSHSEEYVLCGISDKELGVDIEKINEIELDIAEDFFHHREYKVILKQLEEQRLQYFYRIWCLKESYLKYIGTGLSTPLNSFYVNESDGEICIYTAEGQLENIELEILFIDEKYSAAVCYKNNLKYDLERVSLNEIVRVLMEKEKYGI